MKRPGDLRAMQDRWYGANVTLCDVAAHRLDFVAALEYARMALQAADDYVRFNPADSLSWSLWGQSYNQVAGCLFQLGRVQEAIDQAHGAGTELEHDPRQRGGGAGQPLLLLGQRYLNSPAGRPCGAIGRPRKKR